MPKVTLPNDFSACERGNVFLSAEDAYVAWLRLEGNTHLEISLNPFNYPALNVRTVEMTDEQLAKHIQDQFDDWNVHKINLKASVPVHNGLVIGKEDNNAT